LHKCVEDGGSFGTLRGNPLTSLGYFDSRGRTHLGPNIASAARTLPHSLTILTCNSYETKVAYRCFLRTRVALDDDNFAAPARGSQGTREPENTGTDDCYLKLAHTP
jgi:hypothetical protein